MDVGSQPSIRRQVAKRRRWALAAIVIFLLLQLWIPVRYYLGLAEDERFAWRMFSSWGMATRHVIVTEELTNGDERTLKQFTWMRAMSRWPRATEPFMRLRLSRPEVRAVRVEIRGQAVDGSKLETVRRRMTREDQQQP